MSNRYGEALLQMVVKFRKSLIPAAEAGIIPYRSEPGSREWITSPFSGNGWWTGGFWPGLMWQMYVQSGDEAFCAEARRVQELLAEQFRVFSELSHDVGFMYLLGSGADAKLTGSEQARWDTLHAASLMMGRFNPKGYFRAWNGPTQAGYAIIDCMMNLSLLFWASRELKDPRFAHAARVHADTTLREFLRPDGSVSHIIEFNPETGARVQEHPGQGYCLGSQWSRGQAWGLYGFTLVWKNTGDTRYLEAAKRIADNFIAHIRPDGLTDSDFCQPAGEDRVDNMAGAIAACGLWELAASERAASAGNGADQEKSEPEAASQEDAYRKAALRLTDGMLDHCCDWTDNRLGVLTHCTASYHDDGAGRHTNIIYGDYFLAEMLAKINGNDPMLWI